MEMGVHKGYECPRVWSHSQPSLDGQVKATAPHSDVVRCLWFDPGKILLSFPQERYLLDLWHVGSNCHFKKPTRLCLKSFISETSLGCDSLMRGDSLRLHTALPNSLFFPATRTQLIRKRQVPGMRDERNLKLIFNIVEPLVGGCQQSPILSAIQSSYTVAELRSFPSCSGQLCSGQTVLSNTASIATQQRKYRI